MFPRNEAELLALVGNSLRVLSRKEFCKELLGLSESSDKRGEKEDPDHPKFMEMSPNRKGVIERDGRAYVLLKRARALALQGEQVDWAIRVLRGIIHGEVFKDASAAAEEADRRREAADAA